MELLTYVARSNEYLFSIVVAALSLVFALIAHAGNAKAQVVVVGTALVAAYYLHAHASQTFRKHQNITERFDVIEDKEDAKAIPMVFKNTASVVKVPKRVTSIRRREGMMKTVNDVQEFAMYDNAVVSNVVTLLERFLRTYEKVLLDATSCKDAYEPMVDMKNELLNNLSFLTFNVPQTDVRRLTSIAREAHARLSRCLKVVCRKCEATELAKGMFDHEAPSSFDARKSSHEMY